MQQRISLITLGARDAEALVAFYDALGWVRVDTQDGVVVYDLLGQTLGVYPMEHLAQDIGVPADVLGRGAMTLGYNVRNRDDVAPLLERAERAGGQILKPAQDVFWGGHHGYFADLEGHIWEIAWNPFSQLGPNGEFRWNGYA